MRFFRQDIHRGSSSDRETTPDSSPVNNDRNLNYHSFPDSASEKVPPSPNYRGFNTSINDMFTNPDYEQVDCCALACCGILQSDHNRFLVTGKKPPNCFKRFWMHVVFPITILMVAGYCAIMIKDPLLNSIFSCTALFSFFGYCVAQCFKGTWKRQEIRRDLLWSKYQMHTNGEVQERTEDESIQEEVMGENSVPEYYMGQTKSDLRRAHYPCSCYVTDRALRGQDDNSDGENICTRFFQCYTNSCCGALSGMHLQICGICALAQEARQVESLLHPGYRHIDYVTMQPYLEYYPLIYDDRHNEESETSWWERLSQFSKWVIGTSLGFLILLLIWSFFSTSLNHKFAPKNFIVFCATLMQALCLLGIVYRKHAKDVSLDALVKFFAAGFCLSTTLAVFFELLIGLTIRLTMSILLMASGIDVVERDGYSNSSLFASSMPSFGNFWLLASETEGVSSYRDLLLAYGQEHPIVYTIYLLITSFFLAATIEELSKYFGFRMVGHPDFLTKRDLEKTEEVYYDEEEEEGRRPENAPSFSQQDQSMRSRGAAITVSMVAVSLGFACCENLVYIFVYGEATLSMEVLVLLARSLFPIHPVAAALQSIRVCERDLENNPKIKLGRIVGLGLGFHGSYDFFLMFIDYIMSRNGNYVAGDDDVADTSNFSDFYALIVSLFILFLGVCLFFSESRKQRARLIAMDRRSTLTSTVDQSRLI
jgi:RsiW-degrading membrane proteinase PrsW (M82 family)